MEENVWSETRAKQLMNEVLNIRYEQPAKVINICKNIIKMSKSCKYLYGEAFGEYYYAESCYRLGESNQLISHAINGLALQKEQSFYELEARSYNLLGAYFVNQGDVQTALSYYMSGLEIAKKYNIRTLKRMLNNNFGDLYRNLQDYKSAVLFFNRARDIMNENTVDTLSRNEIDYACIRYGNLIEAYLQLDDISKAVQCWNLLLNIMNDDYLNNHKSVFYSMLTKLNYALEKYDQAKSCANIFLNSISSEKDRSLICEIYVPMGMFFLSHSMLDETRELLKYLDEYGKEITNPYQLVQIQSVFIEFYQMTEEKEKLLEAYKSYYLYMKLKENDELKVKSQNINLQMELHKALRMQKSMMQKNQQLQHMSEHDALTGLANRYSINKYADKLFQEACKNKMKFGLIIMDIDYFKQYNDTYGHVMGDECICKVAGKLESLTKEGYLAARYGGDEFLVMSIGREDEVFNNFARLIKQSIVDLKIEHRESLISNYVTVTQGVVNVIPNEKDTVMDLVHMADLALYKVKKHVRNAIGYYDEINEN